MGITKWRAVCPFGCEAFWYKTTLLEPPDHLRCPHCGKHVVLSTFTAVKEDQ